MALFDKQLEMHGWAKKNFMRQGFRKLSSDIHTYIQRDRRGRNYIPRRCGFLIKRFGKYNHTSWGLATRWWCPAITYTVVFYDVLLYTVSQYKVQFGVVGDKALEEISVDQSQNVVEYHVMETSLRRDSGQVWAIIDFNRVSADSFRPKSCASLSLLLVLAGWSSLPDGCCSSVECSSAVCSFYVIAAAVPPRPEDVTVPVIVLFTTVSSFVADCNFNIVRCSCNGPVLEVLP